MSKKHLTKKETEELNITNARKSLFALIKIELGKRKKNKTYKVVNENLLSKIKCRYCKTTIDSDNIYGQCTECYYGNI